MVLNLNMYFLDGVEFAKLAMCSLTVCISYFVKYLFKIFTNFLNEGSNIFVGL